MPEENAKNPSPLVCSRCKGLFIVNTETGEMLPAQCKAYECPECGHRKVQRLYSAIKKYLEDWKHVRMWTFTVKSSVFDENLDLGNKLISEIWHYFVTMVRRDKELSKKQNSFDYIKLLEFHQSGKPHLHVLVSEFLPYNIVLALWEKAIRRFTILKGKVGSCNVSYSVTAKGGAKYVSKYVTKSAMNPNRGKMRLWSKSGKISIFRKNEKNPDWIFISFRNPAKLELYLSQFCVTAQPEEKDFSLFDDPPPEFPLYSYYID